MSLKCRFSDSNKNNVEVKHVYLVDAVERSPRFGSRSFVADSEDATTLFPVTNLESGVLESASNLFSLKWVSTLARSI